MSKNKNNRKKEIDSQKINKIREELRDFEKKSMKENEHIIDSNMFGQILIKTFRNIIIVNTILIIGLIIFLFISTGKNVLRFDAEYFNGIYLVFLMIVSDYGLSFIITSFNKNLKKVYKKKSLWIGIRLLFLTFCLVVLAYTQDISNNDNLKESNVNIENQEYIDIRK